MSDITSDNVFLEVFDTKVKIIIAKHKMKIEIGELRKKLEEVIHKIEEKVLCVSSFNTSKV